MSIVNSFEARRRAQLEAETVKKQNDETSKDEPVEEEIPSMTNVKEINRTTKDSRAISKGNEGAFLQAAFSKIREGSLYDTTSPGVDLATWNRLTEICHSAALTGAKTSQSYRDNVREVEEWDDDRIVEFVERNIDALKSKPGMATALHEAIQTRGLIKVELPDE